MISNHSKKILLALLIFIVMSLVLVFFVVFPLISSIRSIVQDTIGAQREILLLRNQGDEYKRLRSNYELAGQILEEIESRVASADIPVDIITSWEDAAFRSGVEMNLNPLSMEKGKDGLFGKANFQLSLRGEFQQVMNFITEIDNGQYLTVINTLILSPEDDDPENVEGSIELTVAVR